ncbi:MFS transporter [Actinomadura sp. WMMA1423]|uniref:MFS transporter n=1 Tax=Actinomadura sp. WMMA1423 TaxID=2591108 RepID=UPI0011467D5A|nr:MFS transporter [Actinomadura sp. WMMA1423]
MNSGRAVCSRRAGAAVAALALAAFAFATTENLPIGLLTVIADDLEVSTSAVGLLVTGYGVVVAVVSVPLVRLTVRVGRRPLLTGVMAVFLVMTLASAAAPGYRFLFAARLVTALAQAVFWPVAVVAAAGLLPPAARGRAAAYVFGGGSLAIVLGVPAGAWLGRAAGWRMSFAALAVLCLVSFAALAALLPRGEAGGRDPVPASAPDARRFRLLVVTIMLVVGGVFTAFTYVTEFLTRVSGFPDSAVSPLLLANGAADIAGVVVAGIVVDRGPRALLAGSAAVLAAALLGLFAFGTAAVPAVLMLVLLGIGLPCAATAFQARVMESAPGDTDVASAWTSAAFNVGIAGGALFGGVLLPVTGVRGTALAGAAVAGTALAVIAADRPARVRAPTGSGGVTIIRTLNRYEDDGTVRGQDH